MAFTAKSSVRRVAAKRVLGGQSLLTMRFFLAGQMVSARGADETTPWRHPVDLMALCEQAATELPGLLAAAGGCPPWSGHAELSRALLGDDPSGILEAITAAVMAGALPA